MSKNNILITGMSGVGKTSVIDALRTKRFPCIDMDEPDWSYVDYHGYQHWNLEPLVSVLTTADQGPLFVSGCAEEQAQVYDRFSCIVLLSAPIHVMIERIRSRSTVRILMRWRESFLTMSRLSLDCERDAVTK